MAFAPERFPNFAKTAKLDSIRSGYVSYVINTRDIHSMSLNTNGYEIRRCAVENNVTMFTSLDNGAGAAGCFEEVDD